MLALNISTSLGGELDDRPATVHACAEKWWAIGEATLNRFADEVLAIADNRVAGVFTVRGWIRDPDAGNKVVFDLEPATEWQWLVGQPSPISWRRGQANPVRKVGTVITDELRAQRPHHVDAGHGWHLDVDPDGNGVAVRAPGATVAVTAIGPGTARLTILSEGPSNVA